jgi:hypothetical protein
MAEVRVPALEEAVTILAESDWLRSLTFPRLSNCVVLTLRTPNLTLFDVPVLSQVNIVRVSESAIAELNLNSVMTMDTIEVDNIASLERILLNRASPRVVSLTLLPALVDVQICRDVGPNAVVTLSGVPLLPCTAFAKQPLLRAAVDRRWTCDTSRQLTAYRYAMNPGCPCETLLEYGPMCSSVAENQNCMPVELGGLGGDFRRGAYADGGCISWCV